MKRVCLPGFLTVLLGCAACGYLLTLLFYHISSFPGLHGDEAWVGLFALRIKERGLYTPHEMNTYTGFFYGWFLAKLFTWFKPSVFLLRAPGTALNAAAALLLAGHFDRTLGRARALAWFYLLGTSALFILKSRVAWEVYALQGFLLSVILVLSRGFILDKKFTAGRVLLFLTASYAGVFNHFIFISVPLSLFVFLLAELALRGDWARADFFLLAAVDLALAACLYVLKPPITEAQWQAHRGLFGAAFIALPFAAAGVFLYARERVSGRVRMLVERAFAGSGARDAFKAALLAGLALFLAVHLKSLVQIWSGVVVLERMSSLELPALLRWALYAWAAALFWIFFAHAFRNIEPEGPDRLSDYQRFLVLWPLAYAAIFILFRNTSSIRYYIIPSFLITAAMADILPRLEGGPRWGFACAAAAVLLNVCFWRELAWPHDRRPLVFKVGWHSEKSIDFMRKEPLYEVAARERICTTRDHNSFIDLPLLFHLAEKPVDCDPSKVIATRYCPECAGPPYFAWDIRGGAGR